MQPDTNYSECMRARRRLLDQAEYRVEHEEFKHFMQITGFWHMFEVGYHKIDTGLITALAERWRPETNTFHIPTGEITVTLQDVSLLLGLVIDGRPVIGRADYDVEAYCVQYLGRSPPPSAIHGHRLTLQWLGSEFDLTTLSPYASPIVVQQFVRATILRLLGGELFSHKSD